MNWEGVSLSSIALFTSPEVFKVICDKSFHENRKKILPKKTYRIAFIVLWGFYVFVIMAYRLYDMAVYLCVLNSQEKVFQSQPWH